MQDILPDNNYKIVGGNVCENESGDLKFEVGDNMDKRGKGEHPRSVFSGYRKCCMNVAHCEDS